MIETRSLTSTEECRLKVSANRVLRRIFPPKRDEIIGDLRNMRNEEFHNLYSSPNKIRILKLRRKILAGMQLM
jgi:hypothetical protein